MGTNADLAKEILKNKIAFLYPSFVINDIVAKGEEYIVEIDYDINKPGSAHNQLWVVENNKAVFLGTIPKTMASTL